MKKNFKVFTIIIGSLIVSVLLVSHFVLGAFPTTPNNGDVYVKDGIRYVYASASNSWTKQIDPNKTAGNIKQGMIIDTVTGTFPNDGTAALGDVLSTKTFYNSTSTTQTGTMTNKVSSATVLTPSTSDQAFPAGYYGGATGDGKCSGSANLVAGNIKNGVAIFGATGNYDYEASNPIAVGTVLSGKVGFVNGAKITGTMTNVGAQSITPTAAGVAITAGYHNGSGGTTADADLVAGNIKTGVNIWGITGTHAGPGLVFSGGVQTVSDTNGNEIHYQVSDDGKNYLISYAFTQTNKRLPVRGTSAEWNRICTMLSKTFVSAILLNPSSATWTASSILLAYYNGTNFVDTDGASSPILGIITVQ